VHNFMCCINIIIIIIIISIAPQLLVFIMWRNCNYSQPWSNGIFLWVVLIVEDILKDIENGKNIKHIIRRTEALPKTLEDLFATLLDKMEPEDSETALRLFHWAVLATGRLRLREWHHILAFIRGKPPS